MKRPQLTPALIALTLGVALAHKAGACERCGGGGRTYTYNGHQGSYSSGPAYAQASYVPQVVAYAPQAAYVAPQATLYPSYQTSGQSVSEAARPTGFRLRRR